MSNDCLGYPRLCLYYHTQKTQVISCGDYEECEKQMMRVKRAMRVIEMELDSIPLVEDTPTPVPAAPVAPVSVTLEKVETLVPEA
jgi:hypothetical protein